MGGREQARNLQARPRGPGPDSTPGRPGDGSRDDVASVRAGEGPANIDMSDRRSLLVATLGFVLRGNWRSVGELAILHAWLDTWSGLGAVVVGMERHGYELWLAKDRNGWRSTFLHRPHAPARPRTIVSCPPSPPHPEAQSPARSVSPNPSASRWSVSGTSRMDGAWIGSPPQVRISSAIPAERRLPELPNP